MVGSLDRPERRQGRDVGHHRRLADGLRLSLVVVAVRLLRPLPLLAARSVDDLGGEEGHQLVGRNDVAVIEVAGLLGSGLHTTGVRLLPP